MRFALARAGVGFVVATLAAGGCCGGGNAPPERSAAVRSLHPSGAADAAEARRRDVAELILQATEAERETDRAAFALVAADRGTAAVGRTLRAVDTAREISLNNVRNLDTVAYKATVVRVVDGDHPETYTNFEQGSLEKTGRPLDVGIQGLGFFKLRVTDTIGGGIAYTRNGNFFVNNKGELVFGLGDGYRLEPPIILPVGVTEVSITQDGKVRVVQGGQTTTLLVGQIQLSNFINPQGLQTEGGNLYTETEASGPPVAGKPGDHDAGLLLQGFLESSNVDLTRERLRLRFLSDWRAVLMRAVDGEPRPAPAAAPAAAAAAAR
ncbi:MAG TPA: flagellar hook-basal body complex protein [Humisphaera sp.]